MSPLEAKILLHNYKTELISRWPEDIEMHKRAFKVIYKLIDDVLEAQNILGNPLKIVDHTLCYYNKHTNKGECFDSLNS